MRSILPIFLMVSLPLAAQSPSVGGCQIFPADNVWNTAIDTLPVDPNSAAYVASMNATNTMLHPDFGHGTAGGGGIPYDLVPDSQPKVTVPFYYGGDPGPYPIPDNVDIESGSDHHALLIDTGTCELYEIFNLTGGPGSWAGGAGATWSLMSDALRPDPSNSADAAGLAILPGLVRYDETDAGAISHAIRVTADHTRGAHIWPARHDASALTGSQYPPMGQRFRLKAAYDISAFAPHVKTVLQALKTYGMLLADNGTSWHISGVGDMRWNDDEMHALTQVTGDNFEAVDESSLIVDPNSGAVKGSTPPPPTVPSGWVNVVSKNSGKCLDIAGGVNNPDPGHYAQQWTCLGAAQTNQQFMFVDQGSGVYEVQVRSSSLALEVADPTENDNSEPIIQTTYTGQPYENWQLVSVGGGYWTFHKASDTKFVMHVAGNSKLNGAKVHQFLDGTSATQTWSFVAIAGS